MIGYGNGTEFTTITTSSATVTASNSTNLSSSPTIQNISSSTQSPGSSTSTTLSTTNITSYTTFSSSNKTTDFHQDGSEAAEAVVAIIVVLVVVATCLVLVFVIMRKKGKLSKLPCYRPISRSRRSSTASSRRALEENEVMENSVRPHLQEPTTDDMFAIEDYEDAPGRPEGKEEYYYDEVFGQSQFEDETTNNAMRQLYHDGSNNQPEEEMLDFDFETLGIKINDEYTPETGRKYTM